MLKIRLQYTHIQRLSKKKKYLYIYKFDKSSRYQHKIE